MQTTMSCLDCVLAAAFAAYASACPTRPQTIRVAVLFGPSAEAARECHVLEVRGLYSPRSSDMDGSLRTAPQADPSPSDTAEACNLLRRIASLGPPIPAIAPMEDGEEEVDEDEDARVSYSGTNADCVRGRGASTGSAAAAAARAPIGIDLLKAWASWMPHKMTPRKFAVAVRRKIASGLQQGGVWKKANAKARTEPGKGAGTGAKAPTVTDRACYEAGRWRMEGPIASESE